MESRFNYNTREPEYRQVIKTDFIYTYTYKCKDCKHTWTNLKTETKSGN